MPWTVESHWDNMEMQLAGPACPDCDVGLNVVETPVDAPHLECPECGHTEDLPDDDGSWGTIPSANRAGGGQ